MHDFFVGFIYLAYIIFGLAAPFIMLLGYIWVDIFRPQEVAPDLLGGLPISAVIGIAAVVVYVLRDCRDPPRVGWRIILIVLFAFWMTITRFWAEVPDAAAGKWDWAFKTVIFSAAIPFFFRSRIQMEAALLTILAALSGSIMTVAVKVLLSGGHYNINLTLLPGQSGVGESSTLAMLSVVALSIAGFARRHSVIIPWLRYPIYFGFSACCIISALGTYARTGLVSLGAFLVITWLRSRRKLLSGVVIAIGIIVVTPFAEDILGPAWSERMSTIDDPMAESSAAGRIAVWKWTLGYVSEHPFGGSFDVYRIDSFTLPMSNGEILKIHGKAFHSIYFEILGEMGIIGFIIWLLLIAGFFLAMLRLWRQTRIIEGAEWLGDLAACLMTAVTIYMVGGAFVGIGYQPILYDLLAISVAATEYWRRLTTSVPMIVAYGRAGARP